MTGSARTFCRFGSNVCHVERVPRCPSLPACAEHSLLVRATRTCAVQLRYPLQLRRGSTASRLLCVSNEQLRRSEVCSAWFCTQHLPVWVRAHAGLWVAPFVQSFKVCFKLPHATYLTTNAVAFWWFRWGLFVRWKEYTIVPLPSILDMEPCFFEYGAVTREQARGPPVISGPTPSPCGSACACNEHPADLYWVLR